MAEAKVVEMKYISYSLTAKDKGAVDEMSRLINESIKQGWEMEGGLSAITNQALGLNALVQTMVRKEAPPEEDKEEKKDA